MATYTFLVRLKVRTIVYMFCYSYYYIMSRVVASARENISLRREYAYPGSRGFLCSVFVPGHGLGDDQHGQSEAKH